MVNNGAFCDVFTLDRARADHAQIYTISVCILLEKAFFSLHMKCYSLHLKRTMADIFNRMGKTKDPARGTSSKVEDGIATRSASPRILRSRRPFRKIGNDPASNV